MKNKSNLTTQCGKKPKKEFDLHELTRLAMLQAAKSVREENKRFGEPLIVWENNRIKKIPVGKY